MTPVQSGGFSAVNLASLDYIIMFGVATICLGKTAEEREEIERGTLVM
jgi:hypothetical protein